MQTVNVVDTFAMSDWPTMDSFLAENYRPEYIMRDRRLFEWQFGDADAPGQANVVCAYAEDRLIGILGYKPLPLFWGGTARQTVGAWMANWMVAADHRRGAGALIMRRLMEKFPVLLGQGAGDMNVPIATVLKFRIFDRIPRFVAVFDAAKMQDFIVEPDVDISAAPETGPADLDDAGALLIAAGLPEGYDPDWSLYPGLSYGTVRSAEYLAWRYLDHPMFDYLVRAAGDAHRPAVCIFRIERTRGGDNHRVGRLTEFFFPQDDVGARDGRRVLAAALADLRDAGCVFADHYCSANWCRPAIEAAGMQPATDLPIATRLSPVERRHHLQNLEIWTNPRHGIPDGLDALYVTKADGDQDRPN
tara:strand:+ start:3672 stop:4754 length:1083 start_codon:yes stop_codon:yes gene_type:complete